MRYNPLQIETCIVQSSRQCSHKSSLQDVITQSLRDDSWSHALTRSFQKSLVAAKLLVEMIDIVQVCPFNLRDEILLSNVWNILKGGLSDKGDLDHVISHYDPHLTNGIDNSAWNDKTLLTQLMLLADSGFYFHLSRMVNSPEEYQYIQVLFVLHLDPNLFNPKLGRDGDLYPGALPKLLGLPSSVSYVDIKEFVNALHRLSYNHFKLRLFFEAFQRDPARSGRFHYGPARWHSFAATRFLRFLAMASSQ